MLEEARACVGRRHARDGGAAVAVGAFMAVAVVIAVLGAVVDDEDLGGERHVRERREERRDLLAGVLGRDHDG